MRKNTLIYIEMKGLFIKIAGFSEEVHPLGSLSKLDSSICQDILPYVIVLTILNALTVSFGSYRFQLLHR